VSHFKWSQATLSACRVRGGFCCVNDPRRARGANAGRELVADDCSGSNCGKTLIVRWNGTARKQAPSPSPSPAGGGFLDGVAATSATNAWAVGGTSIGMTLILRWNGTLWK
jgi:hypothetical protein